MVACGEGLAVCRPGTPVAIRRWHVRLTSQRTRTATMKLKMLYPAKTGGAADCGFADCLRAAKG